MTRDRKLALLNVERYSLYRLTAVGGAAAITVDRAVSGNWFFAATWLALFVVIAASAYRDRVERLRRESHAGRAPE